jgi:hypothetical protein
MGSAFEVYPVEAGVISNKQEKGLKAKRAIEEGEKFAIPGQAFEAFEPKRENSTEYYWDVSHDVVLRGSGIVTCINDPKGVKGSPKANVHVELENPRGILSLVAKFAIEKGDIIWLDYGASYWNPDED